ncbi:uroporphyrinogen-III synthase [Ferrimonas lipolytica]|uniref:Uroporphyrinogen-III synthase n=1 Tax=Ferrimonas lipolytica TaxID=2724191 RepID=A0A6H1UIG1_9GAMM|nr:uroporphyrinogen-III synthase [Ferrimonas lipolytica]QIZ78103.1 uroporphyrinogen-III synthase [Ferrimonas lipolytica]
MHLLLTRPAGRNEALASRLHALGHQTTIAPMVVIDALPSLDETPLQHADAAFFVSKTAVQFADQQLAGRWPDIPCFAVGAATANALKACGARVFHPAPEAETSEGVLALPQWRTIKNANVTIVRGEGGRTLVADSLQQQGHKVYSWVLYRRSYPVLSPLQLQQWQQTGVTAILATSGEILENFFQQVPIAAHPWLCQQRWLVPVERIAQLARQRGCRDISVIGGAGDDAIIGMIGTLDSYGADPKGPATSV